MPHSPRKILVIGYGNPGRLDDGLGPALARAVAALDVPGVTVDANYQLAAEDALDIADHDVVIFVDASVSGPQPFSLSRVEPKAGLNFTSHVLSPATLLAMARDLFGARTIGYVLAVRGYEFNEFGESLSCAAQANLQQALRLLKAVLGHGGRHPHPGSNAALVEVSSSGDRP